MINVEVKGLKELQAKMSDFAKNQMPAGIMFGLSTLGRGLLAEEKRVMSGVFDKPTPFTLNAIKINHWPKKHELWIDLGLKEIPSKDVTIQGNTLMPHIPGFASHRQRKGSERWLRAAGLMGEGQWLVPARTFKLNQFGNVPGPVAQKMLADVDAYSRAQYRAPIKKTGAKKGKYIWGTMTSRRGRPFSGIFEVTGGNRNWERGRWKLQMVAVDKRPGYDKRFNYVGVAQRYADRHLLKAIESGIVKALMTAR